MRGDRGEESTGGYGVWCRSERDTEFVHTPLCVYVCVCLRVRARACVLCVCARACVRACFRPYAAQVRSAWNTHTHMHTHTHTQVLSAWSKHKDIAVIVNGPGGFEGKIMDVRAAMAKFLQIKGWSVAEQVTAHFTAHFTTHFTTQFTAHVTAQFTTQFTTCCVSAKVLEIKGWSVAEQNIIYKVTLTSHVVVTCIIMFTIIFTLFTSHVTPQPHFVHT